MLRLEFSTKKLRQEDKVLVPTHLPIESDDLWNELLMMRMWSNFILKIKILCRGSFPGSVEMPAL